MIGAFLMKVSVAIAGFALAVSSFFSPQIQKDLADAKILRERVAALEERANVAAASTPQLREGGVGSVDERNFVGGGRYRLSGSGISSTATSIGLTRFRVPTTDVTLTMADFGNVAYGTIEPGNTSRREFVSFSGVTQNSDGSATLTGVTRGLLPISPYTASTTIRYAHSGGSVFIISNPPQLYADAAFKNNNETISNEWTFSLPPLSNTTATQTAQLVNFGQLSSTAVSGASDASLIVKGVVEQAAGVQAASTTITDTTTAPLFIGTNLTSYPYSATYTIPVTGADGKLPPWFISTSTKERYVWDATSMFNGAIGVGTSTPTAAGNFGVNGGFYVTGTTTLAGLNLASSSINVAGIPLRLPRTQGANGDALVNDGTGGTSWGAVGNTLLTWAPDQFATSTNCAGGDATTENLRLRPLHQRIVVNKILMMVKNVASSGTFDVTVYAEDGQSQMFSVTSGTVSAPGIVNIQVASSSLPVGNYWVGTNMNGSASFSFPCLSDNEIALREPANNEPPLQGTVSISSGTPASTFNPNTLTTANNIAPLIRFDN